MSGRKYGMAFPIVIENGTYVEPTEEESVESSLYIILTWLIGTRYFNYYFGCILESYLNTLNSPSQQGLLKYYIFKALATWEPRLLVKTANFTTTFDTVNLELTGVIKRTKVSYNYLASL